ncbi:hypothetical protein CPB84DRAFT_1813865 [Gymnopilus junonius]|uniref:C3H1-type domain-containing protein n=1 Tax=Gymnopilus junonius TaxID=109634 RepID=A0A9P5NTX0_GYMJU|nr:hypothetical protein CPB84DRAFT_1813865 [Gymnopilus junonius]
MASSSAATEAQIRSEIERLTATINQAKAQKNRSWQSGSHHYAPYPPPERSNSYVNPNYKSSNNTPEPGPSTVTPTPPVSGKPVLGGQKKEVVLDGVTFESSRRSLVRKDLPKLAKPAFITKSATPTAPYPHPYARKPGHIPSSRSFRLKALRGRNMTLNNTRRPYPCVAKDVSFFWLIVLFSSSRRLHKKKYVDKPCPRFTTTGACGRGLTCMYQHDPNKIAICWNFLQGNCPKTAETCNLSHDPTPERTPLCVHFLNKGRCTRENCPFPHVNVGRRDGVCRDFAVLGYCERGLDCDKQHVKECPEFAEKGICGTRGCKLPHVIRANRNRKVAAPAPSSVGLSTGDKVEPHGGGEPMVTAEDGQIGDEYISLTFKESDSEDEDEDEDEDEEDAQPPG